MFMNEKFDSNNKKSFWNPHLVINFLVSISLETKTHDKKMYDECICEVETAKISHLIYFYEEERRRMWAEDKHTHK